LKNYFMSCVCVFYVVNNDNNNDFSAFILFDYF